MVVYHHTYGHTGGEGGTALGCEGVTEGSLRGRVDTLYLSIRLHECQSTCQSVRPSSHLLPSLSPPLSLSLLSLSLLIARY